MFEEHVIITDIPLEENQGEVLGGCRCLLLIPKCGRGFSHPEEL